MTPERYKRLQKTLSQRQLDLTLVMENVHKPHNFSAILRSCEAVGIFEAHAIIPDGAISQHHDTAAGAHKWLSVKTYNNTHAPYQLLKDANFQILTASLTADSVDFREVDYNLPTAIVMGSELYGLSDEALEKADRSITIPIQGLVESLNVSVAAAIILYEAQRQRTLSGKYDQCQISPSDYNKILFEWSYPEIAAHHQKIGAPYPQLDHEGYIVSES